MRKQAHTHKNVTRFSKRSHVAGKIKIDFFVSHTLRKYTCPGINLNHHHAMSVNAHKLTASFNNSLLDDCAIRIPMQMQLDQYMKLSLGMYARSDMCVVGMR